MKGGKNMTDKEFVSLYKNDSALTPPSSAKNKILRAAKEELPRKKAKKPSPSFERVVKRLAPIAACFLFICLAVVGFFGVSNEKYQAVYIDVNPSVTLYVNRLGKVSDVEYINEDAEVALDGVKLKKLKAEDALEKMIDAYDKAGYFQQEAELYISAVEKQSKKTEKLLEKLQKRAEKVKGNKKYSVSVCKLTAEDKNEAKAYGISPGKYSVIKKIIEKSPSYTVDDLKDLPMSNLNKLLKDKDKDKESK